MIKAINPNIVDPIIVDMLKEALEDAEKGLTQSLAIATIQTSGKSTNAFHANYCPVVLLGEMRIMEREIIDIHIDTRINHE